MSGKKVEFDWIIEENNPDIYQPFMRTEATADKFIDGRVKLSKLSKFWLIINYQLLIIMCKLQHKTSTEKKENFTEAAVL